MRERHFSERVYTMVRRIPYGKVCSYGDVAALLGQPRAARGVGQALATLPQPSDVPWWRVVNRSGQISIRHHGRALQRMLLHQEGVGFIGSRVDLRRFGWRPGVGAPNGEEKG
jgi:methylated-DNA-protein-cysteine methyltransferase related protein